MNPTKGEIVTHSDSGAQGVALAIYGNSVSVSVLRGGVNRQGSALMAGDRALWLISNLQLKAEQ